MDTTITETARQPEISGVNRFDPAWCEDEYGFVSEAIEGEVTITDAEGNEYTYPYQATFEANREKDAIYFPEWGATETTVDYTNVLIGVSIAKEARSYPNEEIYAETFSEAERKTIEGEIAKRLW